MADCGASGTALDQAARAFIGNSTSGAHAQKQIGNLLGHAALAGPTLQGATPASRPATLALHNGGGGDSLLAAMPMSANLNVNHHQSGRSSHHMAGPVVATAPPGSHMAMMQQQQHHMAAAVMQQQMQQQHMMMMQKQHYDRMVIQQQQHVTQLKVAQESAVQEANEVAENADLDNYVEEGNVQGASIEELAAAWTEAQGEGAQDEGNVQGASIEELAAAWAEAQDDYYGSEPLFEGDPSDLFSEENNLSHKPSYQFVNKIDSGNTELSPGTDFMEQGMRHFDNGDLVEAIQNFETELQVNDPDNATAWRMLGRCHAENDQDREAIVCLETAVDRDPYCAESMLALGVSYVNELNHAKALNILKEWITMNPKYAGMEVVASHDLYGDGTPNREGGNDADFQELQSLLLQALEFDGSDAADVWEALGVAANVSRDFETAIEAFRKAIDARPNDYQLWNKLGATLANSNRSDQALPAYHKAIELKPKYARAWLNLAISHSNLKEFDEASRCYLQTLSLNPAAVHCWSYLRVALSCSERWDLIPFAASQNLDAFKEHFDFVSATQVNLN